MRWLVLFLLFTLMFSFSYGQEEGVYGKISGKVIDKENKQPLPGVNIIIDNQASGTVSSVNGEYKFKKIKAGNYTLIFSYVGYEKITRTDIIVRGERITFVNAELNPVTVDLENITVTSGYFDGQDIQPLSLTSFSYEEIRRAPGAGGDVSRIISGLPSLAKVNDTKNSLIVRGGSPVENGFFIDNIEIPNINHFPVQGSTEGPIGILNVDFIENVNFYSGGFSSFYGDKLSSIMELKFREGNRSVIDAQLDMSLQGFGGIIEGPFDGGNGSYMISARRSYLDLVLDFMNENVGLPVYSDVQGKAVYDISENNKLSFLNIFSHDNQKMNGDDAAENGNNVYTDYNYYSNTAGINLLTLWGKNGYTNTSFSHTYSKTNGKYFQTRDARLLFNNKSAEQEFKIRNSNHFIVDSLSKFDFGVDLKYSINNYNQFFNEYLNKTGELSPALNLIDKLRSYRLGGFAEYTWKPSFHFTVKPGIRADYYNLNRSFVLSPRFSLTYHFNELTSITGQFGIYHQGVPNVIAAQNEKFNTLKNSRSTHYVLGLNHLLNESTKLTVEVYNKDYTDFPMDPLQPNQWLFDQAMIENVFLTHQDLYSTGKANSKGIEVTIQKKLAKDFYGLIGGSYYRAKYKGLDNKWYNRIYDNKFNFTIEGGYKPNESWEFSLRWLYAGGAPYTPFDITASTKAYKGIFDITKVNSGRLPDFHSLNLRADKRFHFQSSTLIVYLSVWNAYGRKNIAAYTWDEINNKISEEEMWGLLPIFGIEYEF